MMNDPFAVDRMRFDAESRPRRTPGVRRLRGRDARRLALSALQNRRSSEV